MALILVVEDEPVVQQVIKATLEEEHLILEAATGEDALRLVKRVRPALVILDINLNGGSRITGIQVCTMLATTPALAGMPILAMSGRADRHSISETETAGATGFLAKPFKPVELRQRVAKLLTIQVETVAHYLMSLGEDELIKAFKLALRRGNTLKITRGMRQAILDVENELADA